MLSSIGLLIAKAIYRHSTEKILVVCYTHHALDQFLEELLDLGIPESDIVRLGSPTKATTRTQPLSLKEMRQSVKLSQGQWRMLNLRKDLVREKSRNLHEAFKVFSQANAVKSDIMEHLEFKMDGPPLL
jgi:Rad3-related DNA helicase